MVRKRASSTYPPERWCMETGLGMRMNDVSTVMDFLPVTKIPATGRSHTILV
jgi:hypothetical protein